MGMEVEQTLSSQLYIPETFIEVGSFKLHVEELNLSKGLYQLHGGNGSGKTTFFRYLLGLLNQQNDFPNENIIPKIKGFVPQNYREALLPWLSAKGNLEIFPDKSVQAIELAFSLGLKDIDLTKSIYQLSGGQAQRLAVAKELAFNPDLLIMDEPFSALDKDSSKSTLEAILKYASAKNKLAIITTHIPLHNLVPNLEAKTLKIERIYENESKLWCKY